MMQGVPKWTQLRPHLNYVGLNSGPRCPPTIRKVQINLDVGLDMGYLVLGWVLLWRNIVL